MMGSGIMRIVIDGRQVEAEEGKTALRACLDAGIYVPHLCALDGEELPGASCRLCLVELEDTGQIVPSCTIKVKEGLRIRTDTEAVRNLQRSCLRLLLSAHEVDCRTCPVNKRCPLQEAASFLKVGLKPKGLDKVLKRDSVQRLNAVLVYHPNKCVLCGHCLKACSDGRGSPLLTFAGRGFDTVVAFFGAEEEGACADCMKCVRICPVAAIRGREEIMMSDECGTCISPEVV
jgi:NADH dehydrogenase/NADH:ubiquinone oxidoreductase subunit G